MQRTMRVRLKLSDFIDTDINWDELMGHFEEEENE